MRESTGSESTGKGVGPLPRTTLYLVDILFLLSMAILPLVWLLDPLHLAMGPLKLHVGWGAKPLVAPVALIILRWLVWRWARSPRTGAGGLLQIKVVSLGCKLVTSLYLTVALLEGALAVMGYELDMAPVIFSLKDEAGQVEEQKGFADPELIYKFRKGEYYYGTMINSLGFRDREVDPVKAEGMMRVICMGDSCTAQGKPSYTGYLHETLTEKPITGTAWEAFNMAVYGYTSMQGLRVFQKQGKYLAPDVVTLYFGWNDHWLNMQSDRARMAVSMTPFQAKCYERLRKKRTFMLLKQLTEPGMRFNKPRAEAGPRVPHDEYRAVLTEFIAEIRGVGATPLLITAPRRDADTWDVHAGFEDVEIDFNVVHDEYMEITRELGADLDVDVLDLHRTLAAEEYDNFFTDDGIHLTQKGLRYVAGALYEQLGEMHRSGRILSAR